MKDISKIIDQLSKLTISDTLELTKELEKRWGVSNSTISNKDKENNGSIEKSSYKLYLESVGNKRIKVISAIKSIVGSSLKQAKILTDSIPSIIKTFSSLEEAENAKKKLLLEGATVKIK